MDGSGTLDKGSGRYMLAPGLSAHFGDQKAEHRDAANMYQPDPLGPTP